MHTTQAVQGSALVQGELWGTRARDYADFQEPQMSALFEDAIRRTGVDLGSTVLDVGCGPGGFCRLAVEAGATVTGIDASQALVEISRERVPSGRFDVGDMQFLPYEDDSFEVVTGFNSFQYAADRVAALREARRVARPGGIVHVVVWGREDRTELVAALRALGPLLPPAPPGAPGPFALSNPGALEALVEQADLTPTDDGYIEITFEYPNETALLKGNNSNGPVVLAERTSGEAAVANAIRDVLATFRTSAGVYRIETEWRYVTARV
ncbi:MAG TPA: class I SAM-dependent methyltransferase [Solirubrobacteraceae bacterium]|nr:class I SAM-dependent methyltransferase [Solirubrobacteraceae bacterium]